MIFWRRKDSPDRARKLLARGRLPDAFAMLNRLKATHAALAGVDSLRADYFLITNQAYAAVEALKEELRFFPDDTAAKNRLMTLQREHLLPNVDADPEFHKLYEVIRPYTMVWPARLQNLYKLAREVCEQDVPGQFVECGVAGGGTSALLAAVISAHSKRPRVLYAFDSFQGMPAPGAEDIHEGQEAENTGWGTGTCSAPETSLLTVCSKLGVEKLVKPVKGWFSETLPVWKKQIGGIAFLHIDGDWYSSTLDVLNNLYNQLERGASIQIDDYGY